MELGEGEGHFLRGGGDHSLGIPDLRGWRAAALRQNASRGVQSPPAVASPCPLGSGSLALGFIQNWTLPAALWGWGDELASGQAIWWPPSASAQKAVAAAPLPCKGHMQPASWKTWSSSWAEAESREEDKGPTSGREGFADPRAGYLAENNMTSQTGKGFLGVGFTGLSGERGCWLPEGGGGGSDPH